MTCTRYGQRHWWMIMSDIAFQILVHFGMEYQKDFCVWGFVPVVI